MPKRVRLIDIAERLNITKVTVSKALRDHPDISRETRALVKKLAAEMEYSPNLVARSLSSRRSNVLGVVVPKIAHTFFSSLLDSVQQYATEHGYGILLAVSNEQSRLEREHIDRLLAMRVDGLLVSVSQEAPDLGIYEKVRQMRVPLVFFDREVPGLPFSSVTVDDRRGAREAVSFLIEKGFRGIAHAAGSPATLIGRERRAGYEEALQAAGIPIFEPWVPEGAFDEQFGYAAGKSILRSGRVPEAFFAVSFPVALGIRAALAETDRRLLETIQIVSFGDGGFNEFYTFPHYCIRQPVDEMGRKAVAMLLAEIEHQQESRSPEIAVDEGTERVVLATEIVAPFAKSASVNGRVGADPPAPTTAP